eukprot:m.132321 g.132321  ORF g.132321 m.132321 type:complete len:651 (+) comp11330_c0_seq2:257-2209(+)
MVKRTRGDKGEGAADAAPAAVPDEQEDDGAMVGPPIPGAAADNEDEFVGPPIPGAAGAADGGAKRRKKKRVLQHGRLYLDALPSAAMYETSYAHREPVTHIVVTRTDFIITGSADGVLMFWKKKNEGGIEFVKTFRSHLAAIAGMGGSEDGYYLATTSSDKALKIYDILNFDMINMMKLDYEPGLVEWIHVLGALVPMVAVSDKAGPAIHVYDGKGGSVPLHTVNVHHAPVTAMRLNAVAGVVISADEAGMIEYWRADGDFGFPSDKVKFALKSDTGLYDYVKHKAVAWGVDVSPNGKYWASLASDRRVRVFGFAKGSLLRVYDESIDAFMASETGGSLDMMELGRKVASEKDLLKSSMVRLENCKFDESSNFLLYPTAIGIKVINLVTNKCARTIGKSEPNRHLRVALFQGQAKDEINAAAETLEMEVADNPQLRQDLTDPTLFCSAYKKPRFFMFTRREPEEQGGDVGRDVFNLKPTREEQLAASGVLNKRKLAETVTIHTTLGDITISLFLRECPKTVENFVTHCRDGYYNGLLFHRVIKNFMIQTGDPDGDGTGGQSIWGEDFEDEFDASLRHDRPYTVSMANAGPNTNGSQFFITLVPTPWLDKKHTVFGRVMKGMETCQEIGNTKTDKDEKPLEDVKIINVSVR